MVTIPELGTHTPPKWVALMYGDGSGLSTEFTRVGAVNETAIPGDFTCYDVVAIMLPATDGTPSPLESFELRRALAVASVRSHGSVVVALSGGVDSAALLALSVEALGAAKVIAVTGRSDAVTSQELEDAATVAAALGVRHEIIETHEMDRPGYKANAGDRCFHCRTELFELLRDFARSRDIPAVAYGAILDDLGDHRPGMQAARRHGIVAPLLDAKISKIEARALAKAAGLHVSDKPASPCLASRIPVGTEVTGERLSQVEHAEGGLRALGFRELRVRHHGETARLELGADELARLADPSLRSRAIAAVRRAGFRTVVVDPAGYRPSGGAPGGAGAGLYSIDPSRESGQ